MGHHQQICAKQEKRENSAEVDSDAVAQHAAQQGWRPGDSTGDPIYSDPSPHTRNDLAEDNSSQHSSRSDHPGHHTHRQYGKRQPPIGYFKQIVGPNLVGTQQQTLKEDISQRKRNIAEGKCKTVRWKTERTGSPAEDRESDQDKARSNDQGE